MKTLNELTDLLNELNAKKETLQNAISSLNVDIETSEENIVNLKAQIHLNQSSGSGLKEMFKQHEQFTARLSEAELDLTSLQIAIQELTVQIDEAKRVERMNRLEEAQKEFTEIMSTIRKPVNDLIGSFARLNVLHKLIYQNKGIPSYQYMEIVSFYQRDVMLALKMLPEMNLHLDQKTFWEIKRKHQADIGASC